MSDDAMTAVRRKAGLGRGLDALLGDIRPTRGQGEPDDAVPVRLLPLSAIEPDPLQPRRRFDEAALAELAENIAARGVLQPIVVRPLGDDRFQIVAGERRWRAAGLAGLDAIPAVVRAFTDAEAFEIALIENIQRQDLNAIEEADGYRRLAVEYGHSQAELARLVGKSRSHVANLIRLLDLPETVRAMVADGRLSMGHARALIGRPDAEALAERAVRDGLTVRAVEALGRTPRASAKCSRKAAPAQDHDLKALESQLGDLLGLTVRIVARGSDGAGVISLDYRTFDQLDLLCQRLSGERF